MHSASTCAAGGSNCNVPQATVSVQCSKNAYAVVKAPLGVAADDVNEEKGRPTLRSSLVSAALVCHRENAAVVIR